MSVYFVLHHPGCFCKCQHCPLPWADGKRVAVFVSIYQFYSQVPGFRIVMPHDGLGGKEMGLPWVFIGSL